jgi:hypothetical protein
VRPELLSANCRKTGGARLSLRNLAKLYVAQSAQLLFALLLGFRVGWIIQFCLCAIFEDSPRILMGPHRLLWPSISSCDKCRD